MNREVEICLSAKFYSHAYLRLMLVLTSRLFRHALKSLGQLLLAEG